MKKIYIMLMIAISAIATVNAQTSRKQTVSQPVNVIKMLNSIIDHYGQQDKQSYSVKRNPTTNIIESSEKRVHFSDPDFGWKNDLSRLRQIGDSFTKDEPVSYQFKHLSPGNNDFFSLSVLTETGMSSTSIPIRTAPEEEMWYMCCKNAENPQLRDAYAITWLVDDDGVWSGDIYIITSLRPDIYDKALEQSANTFKIDGRVGSDLTDSLYVFYMADTYEELNDITMRTDNYEVLKSLADHEHVAYMPVTNKYFELSVKINKRKAGRIRTVMPDGSLCKIWTNIDMVPGETYRITTHNGWYDSDRDYEQRVGYYSGKSLFFGHDNDDVEITGGYPEDEDDVVVHEGDISPTTINSADAFMSLSPVQQIAINLHAGACKSTWESIERTHQTIESLAGLDFSNSGGTKAAWEALNPLFKQLTKQYGMLDKNIEGVEVVLEKNKIPESMIMDMYKELLGLLTEQNKALHEVTEGFGTPSSAAVKCQTAIYKLGEKYLNKSVDHMLK